MLRILLAILFACFLPALLQAQPGKRWNNWYFSDYASISFNTIPPSEPANSQMLSSHASASISDPITGALLFYTNGVRVWNRQHQVMSNGSKIIQEPTATCCLIMPFPGNPDKYFVFSLNFDAVLSYSVVNMQGAGGLGEVETINQVMHLATANFFTAARHAFGNAWWLITRSTDNRFLNYLVDENGVSSQPVESTVETLWGNINDIKTSFDGQKIAMSVGEDVYLYDMDKICGQVSAIKKLSKETLWNPAVGVCFAPDNQSLYVVYGAGSRCYIIRYHDPNFSSYWVVNSSTAVLGEFFDHLQMGPDSVLYIARDGLKNGVSVLYGIKNPNTFSNTQPDIFSFSAGIRSEHHFPNNINDWTDPATDTSVVPIIRNPWLCASQSGDFSLNNAGQKADSLRWDFGDPSSGANNSSTLFSPTHTYLLAGTYQVKISWYRCGLKYEVKKTIQVFDQLAFKLGKDSTACHGTQVILSASLQAQYYQWSTGDSTASIIVNKAGTYWLKAGNTQCSASDTIEIKYHAPLWTALGDEYFICEADKELVKLDAGEGFASYLWQPTGDTSQWIIVAQTGNYYSIIKDFRGCPGEDSTKVKRKCPFYLFFPTAFSPNADGVNDVYKAVATDIVEFHMEIYNRWGEKVFESFDPDAAWDGNYRNKAAEEGVYAYVCQYKGLTLKKIPRQYSRSGTITLMR